jgi:hypothetical protein
MRLQDDIDLVIVHAQAGLFRGAMGRQTLQKQ